MRLRSEKRNTQACQDDNSNAKKSKRDESLLLHPPSLIKVENLHRHNSPNRNIRGNEIEEIDNQNGNNSCVTKKNNGKAHFFVRNCFDVFFEMLLFGNRRQLAKLERIGRRFHIVVDGKFKEAPFLRLNLTWNPSSICISSRMIADGVLPAPSSYLRFGVVSLNYRLDGQPISEKCESIRKHLTSLSATLNGAKLKFDGRIDPYDPSDFHDNSMLLAHIGNELLPICNQCRAYEFHICFPMFPLFEQDPSSAISSILKMEPVRHCYYVKLTLLGIDSQKALPVEAITNWFFHGVDDRKHKKQKVKEKVLSIRHSKILNGTEVIHRLNEIAKQNSVPTSTFTFLYGDLLTDDKLKTTGDQIKSTQAEIRRLEEELKRKRKK